MYPISEDCVSGFASMNICLLCSEIKCFPIKTYPSGKLKQKSLPCSF